jgi:hypothetical protein
VPFLATLAGLFLFVALFAWLVVAAGWVVSMRREPKSSI